VGHKHCQDTSPRDVSTSWSAQCYKGNEVETGSVALHSTLTAPIQHKCSRIYK